MICSRRKKITCLPFVLLIIFAFTGIGASGQLLESRISIDLAPGSLDRCILQLQQTTGYAFAYESSGLRVFSIQGKSFRNEKLNTVLLYLLDGSGYFFEERHNVIVIGPNRNSAKRNVRQFRGVIEDKETGERLKGVAVYDARDMHTGTFTDKDGYFSLAAPADTLKLLLSYLSYKPVEILLHAADAPMVRIKMDVAMKDLDSVLFVLPDDITPFSPLSKVSPVAGDMSFLPKFFGNADLLSMIKITPGVVESTDGSGSLIVRGGAPDQNLLLLDGMNIYGATHLFGLLSSVNAYAVKDMNVYKGSFPARYGGRISSVWDIYLKNGDPEEFHGNLSVGTMAADLMLEGPIVKNKTSFLVSGRRSYHDHYVRLFTPGLTFYFQDLNVKLHHRFSDRDHLYFTGYTSKDRFQLNSDVTEQDNSYMSQSIGLNTKNNASALRWRHYHPGNIVTDMSLIYSGYDLQVSNRIDNQLRIDTIVIFSRQAEELINSGLHDITANFNARYSPGGNHEFEAGIYYIKHSFDPHSFIVKFTSSNTLLFPPPPTYKEVINDKAVNEAGLFIEDQAMLLPNVKVSAGLHLNKYFYQDVSYFSAQPRINIRYEVARKWSLNGAYVRMQQSLHRLSISQTSLPVDFWIPSTDAIKPQLSDQVSLGVSGRPGNGLFELSLETYYKEISNVAEYLIFRSDTSFSASEASWSQEVVTGKGAAYGVECSISKSKGRFRGWLSYALSWSNRTLPEVNNGKTFPYKYDRRHNLNLINTYKVGKSLELSAVFSFQSKPRSPVLIIKTDDMSRNAEELKASVAQAELSAYHRLDLGISWHIKYRKRLSANWNLSVLNVYNRENAFFYFSNNNSNQLSGTSLLPISVSLSYTLSF